MLQGAAPGVPCEGVARVRKRERLVFVDKNELIAHGLAAFDAVVASTPGFRPRPGQRAMAMSVAEAFATGTLGDDPDPVRAVHVIQAGTGVGKSASYASVGIALARARGTRLLIASASVNLQEQLMNKDLPQLAASMPEPFKFALAVGRARYVCLAKLHRRAQAGLQGDLEGDEGEEDPAASREAPPRGQTERRVAFYRSLAQALEEGWPGDRDSLPEQPSAGDWAQVAADRHTCTARACPEYRSCKFYAARARLADADVIVANHDLLLASLGSKILPELDSCLLLIDEGHDLPECAQDHFKKTLDLSRVRWLDRLPRVISSVAGKIGHQIDPQLPQLAAELKCAMGDVARMIFDHAGSYMRQNDGVCRFRNGVVPEFLHEPLRLIRSHATAISGQMVALANALREAMKQDSAQKANLSALYASVGIYAPKVGAITETTAMLLDDSELPVAKWIAADVQSSYVGVQLHACPVIPGDTLAQQLWPGVRAAVITSATLTSCGSFDFYLGEAGLAADPAVKTLAATSPFDYKSQGKLVVVQTIADPRQVEAYTKEVAQSLSEDLSWVTSGALVLCTSKAQMRAVVDAMPATIRERVLLQGTAPRAQLIAQHRERVKMGLASILVGLQSFGTGLDLPGKECETLMIVKLPFAPPTDAIGEARAEHVRRSGGDPFEELVVPATGVRLQQWTGRAIRTETDSATIICYDKRLTTQAYGRRILRGLPPYPVHPRHGMRQQELVA